jgi:hypothetical protein
MGHDVEIKRTERYQTLIILIIIFSGHIINLTYGERNNNTYVLYNIISS